MATPFSRTARALALDSARPALFAWLVAALGLAAWLAWFFAGGITLVEVSRQARLEVSQAPHPLAPVQAGKVAETALEIGRTVRAGDVLVTLDTTAATLQLKEEEARAQAIPPRLALLREELAAQRAAVQADQAAAVEATQVARAHTAEATAAAEFAVDHARRLRDEAKGGSVAEIDALRAETDARRLGAGRDGAAAEVRKQALDARTRAEQGRVQVEALRRAMVTLEGELATSQATQARLAEEIARAHVRAPVAGVLAEVQPLRPGAYVVAGQKLATIVPAGELLVVAEFDPASALGRVKPGQIAQVRLDGYPWAQYGSVTARVLRVAGELRGQLLRAELQLTAAPPASLPLQHGLAGVVEVEVETLSPAVVALRAAGRALDGTPAPAVAAQRVASQAR